MTRVPLIALSFLLGVLLVCAPLSAHHGAAAYSDQVMILKDATVTKFIWANPHCIVMFDVKDDKGTLTHWAGEVGSPSAVGLLGWNRNSLQSGDVVTVYIYAAKSGNPVGRLNKVIFSDGRTLRDSQLGGDNKPKDQ